MFSILYTTTNMQNYKRNKIPFLFQKPDCGRKTNTSEIVETNDNGQTCTASVTVKGCYGYCESYLYWLPKSLEPNPHQCTNSYIYGVASDKECSCTCCKPTELVTEIQEVTFTCTNPATTYDRNVAVSMAGKCECVTW